MSDRERDTHRERQRHRQGEKQTPCREPDVGLDPRTLGSHPEPKADVQLLNHPGIPQLQILITSTKYIHSNIQMYLTKTGIIIKLS